MEPCVVGIDVAQQELVMVQLPGGEVSRWTNDAAGQQGLAATLLPLAPERIVLEGTGGLEQGVVTVLQAHHLPVAVVNPRQVRDFAKGLGKRVKTDPIDAAVLAQFARIVQPPLTMPRTDAVVTLRALVTRRRQVRQMRVAEKNRLPQAHPAVQPSLVHSIAALDAEVRSLERQITALLKQHPECHRLHVLLRSMPGIGLISAATLIAELPELGTCSDKQIAALIGVAPFTQQSGASQGRATIQGGRRAVRTCLFISALVASKHNPLLAAFYAQLLARHKPKKVALTAVMRRMITMLNAMVRDGTIWNPEVNQA